MSTQPVQPLTKTDAAYREIRGAIESGRLEPGSRLLIGDLEKLLGMSPTPIREALRLLQRDALVDYTPHYGTVVASFNANVAAENHRVRIVLEPLATELAAMRASDEELAEIRARHDEFTQAVASDPRGQQAPRLNAEWHAAVYRASHSDQLIEFIERLWRVMGATKFFSVHGERSAAEHEQVMRGLEQHNPDEAAATMRAHLGNVNSEIADHAPRTVD
jgi:DNA-binding GntR family transcriptional regulator